MTVDKVNKDKVTCFDLDVIVKDGELYVVDIDDVKRIGPMITQKIRFKVGAMQWRHPKHAPGTDRSDKMEPLNIPVLEGRMVVENNATGHQVVSHPISDGDTIVILNKYGTEVGKYTIL